jgi:hypothetical protein
MVAAPKSYFLLPKLIEQLPDHSKYGVANIYFGLSRKSTLCLKLKVRMDAQKASLYIIVLKTKRFGGSTRKNLNRCLLRFFKSH